MHRAMKVSGIDSIKPYTDLPAYFVKCLLTDFAAVLFPGSLQHRDVKRDGVSYEDDYRGNALAATITPARIDIRFHKDYADDRVRRICRELRQSPEMDWASSFAAFYQGRLVTP